MKAFLLFAALFVAVSSSSINSHCKWGPSYWCQSHDNAIKCGQVKYCRTEVWQKQESITDKLLLHGAPLSSWKSYKNIYKPPATSQAGEAAAASSRAPKDGLCDVCMIMMSYVKKAIDDNTTEADAQKFLEKTCAKLNFTKCTEFIKNDFGIIWGLLKQDSDPKAVCKFLKICAGSSKVKRSVLQLSKPSSDIVTDFDFSSVKCDLCDLFVKPIVAIFKSDKDKDKVKADAEAICRKMTPVSSECLAFVDKHFDQIWKMIASETSSPQVICHEIFSDCPTSLTTTSTIRATKLRFRRGITNWIECKVCKGILPKLVEKIKNEDITGKIMKMIDPYCAALPSDEQTQCKVFFGAIVKVLVDDILNATTGNITALCIELGYCTKKEDSQVVAPKLLLRSTRPRVQKRSVDITECEVCQKVVNTVVENNSSEKIAKLAVEQLCDVLPAPGPTLCKLLVSEYFDKLWDYVKNEVGNVTEFCDKIHMCKSSLKGTNMKIKVKGDTECDACKVVVGYIDQLLKEGKTEDIIKDEIEQVCNYLGPVAIECRSIVDTYFPLIWNLLVNKTNPDTICSAIGLCPNSHLNLLQHVLQQLQLSSDGECSLCKLVVNYIDSLLADNKTKTEVEDELKQICNGLGSLKDQCDQLVGQYFPIIWQYLLEEFKPDPICKLIGLCTNSTKQLPVTESQTLLKGAPPDECKICEILVLFFKKEIESNKTEKELEIELEFMCNDTDFKIECKSIIREFFPLFWELVTEKISPSDICTKLGVCSTVSIQLKQKVKRKDDEVCDLCKAVAKEVYALAQESGTKAKVKDFLESICKDLQSDECTQFINQYFDMLWNYFIPEMKNSTKFCIEMELCESNFTASSLMHIVQHIQQMIRSKIRMLHVKDDELCDLCKIAAKDVFSLAMQNGTKAKVKDMLLSLCKDLQSDECTQLVNQFFDIGWVMVLEELKNSTKFCMEIELCTSKVKALGVQSVQSGTECALCEFAIKEIENMLQKNATEQQIIAAVEKVCSLLPSTITDECTSLIKQYGPEIIKLLIDEADPKTVCTTIGLCSSSTTVQSVTHSIKERAIPQSPMCNFCISTSEDFYGILQSQKNKEEAKGFWLKVCKDSNVDGCADFVNHYFDDVWNAMMKIAKNGTPPCQDIGVCAGGPPSVKHKTFKYNMKDPADDICDLCKAFSKEFYIVLQSKTYKEESVKFWLKACDDAHYDACTQFVVETYDLIWNFISYDFKNATKTCELAGMCDAKTSTVKHQSVKASPWCPLCEAIMKEVESLLKEKSTEAEIEAALDKVCDALPSDYVSECKAFVQQYASVIIKMIVDNVSPDQICAKLGLCSTTTDHRLTKPVIQNVKAGPYCTICEFVIKELISLVGNNATEQRIIQGLDQVCDKLPSTISSECEDFVNKYGPEIINLLLNNASPEQICTALTLCSSSSIHLTKSVHKRSLSHVQTHQVQAGPLCPICEFVMKELISKLGDNATKQEIIDALDQVCDALPSTVSSECEELVNKYGPEIISLLNNTSPQQICTALTLCSSSTIQLTKSVHKRSLSHVETRQIQAGPECVLCEFVIKELESLIQDNSTEQQIIQALDKVCTLLPSTITDECEKFVKEYAPEIIKLIINDVPPKEVCSKLGLCSNSSVVKITDPVSKGDCQACEDVLDVIKDLLPKTTTISTDLLEDACKLSPSNIRDECIALVKTYGPELIKLLAGEIDPQKICKFIKVCR